MSLKGKLNYSQSNFKLKLELNCLAIFAAFVQKKQLNIKVKVACIHSNKECFNSKARILAISNIVIIRPKRKLPSTAALARACQKQTSGDQRFSSIYST